MIVVTGRRYLCEGYRREVIFYSPPSIFSKSTREIIAHTD